MTSDLIPRLRRHLDEERASLIEELAQYGADPDTDRVEHIQGIDENFADLAAATAERSETLAFIEKARDRLAEVDVALDKMDQGTYGVCEVCGGAIPEARLEARPLSVRCVQCASKP